MDTEQMLAGNCSTQLWNSHSCDRHATCYLSEDSTSVTHNTNDS